MRVRDLLAEIPPDTHLIGDRLDGAIPGLFNAYWTMLPRQPERTRIERCP